MQTVIDKTKGHQETSVAIWIDMIHAVWWISISWLSLASTVMVYLVVRWAIMKNDPLRYETAFGSAFVFFGSFPAGLGVLIAALVPKTGLSIYKRVVGIALLLFCIGVLMLHDYLQAKYR